jgi:hypothetical protein
MADNMSFISARLCEELCGTLREIHFLSFLVTPKVLEIPEDEKRNCRNTVNAPVQCH